MQNRLARMQERSWMVHEGLGMIQERIGMIRNWIGTIPEGLPMIQSFLVLVPRELANPAIDLAAQVGCVVGDSRGDCSVVAARCQRLHGLFQLGGLVGNHLKTVAAA